MFTIRKRFKFCAAHRLISSYSKCCQNIHGHNYIVDVFFQSRTLNEDDMVIDFGLVKNEFQGIIDEWDHAFIGRSCFSDTDLKVFNVNWNPTAENMARFLFNRFNDTMKRRQLVPVIKVRVHETDTGWAEYEED